MKKYYLFLAIAFAACNNENSKPGGSGAAKTAAPQTETAASGGSGGDCSSLVLFRKGAILEAITYDAAGKQSVKQTTTITDVKEEGGMTVATAAAVSNTAQGEKTMNMVYKCDGKNLYMDLNSMMQNFAVLKDAKTEVENLSFPINMKEGETLPESSMTVAMDRTGTKMNIKTTYKNRTVGAKEKITTPAGSWDCYKVNADIDSEVEGLDETTKKVMEAMKEKMKMQMIMWVAPGFGMVKMEMLNGGKRTSYTEITSVK